MYMVIASMYHPPIPTWASKIDIQGATERFASRNHLGPRFPLLKLIKSLGGNVDYKFFKASNIESESIYVNSKTDFTIFLATDTSPLRDRFTLAHELGHYFLHYPVVLNKHGSTARMSATRFVDPSSDELKRAEWEANWFAGALLMPSENFKKQFDDTDGDLESIAEYFEVTTVAAEVRAKSLGLM